MKKISAWAFAMAAATAAPTTVSAQENASALGGPIVSGVCLLGREAVFANAAAGKNVSEQLQKLTANAQAEISREQTQLDPELDRLGLRKPGLQEAQLNDQQRSAVQKLKALQEKAGERSKQIEAARLKALQRISEEAQPLIAQSYARHQCGLLLNRAGVLGGNLGNDLTAEVVKALDAKLSTIPVALEAAPK